MALVRYFTVMPYPLERVEWALAAELDGRLGSLADLAFARCSDLLAEATGGAPAIRRGPVTVRLGMRARLQSKAIVAMSWEVDGGEGPILDGDLGIASLGAEATTMSLSGHCRLPAWSELPAGLAAPIVESTAKMFIDGLARAVALTLTEGAEAPGRRPLGAV